MCWILVYKILTNFIFDAIFLFYEQRRAGVRLLTSFFSFISGLLCSRISDLELLSEVSGRKVCQGF